MNNTNSTNPPSTPNPAPVPETEPSASHSPGPWNKAQLGELSKAERLCVLALTDPHKPVFLKNEFPPERLTAFKDKIMAARNQAAVAGQSNTAAASVTLSEETAEKLLVADIRKVQAKAKQKYARKNPIALKDFMVGTDVTESRPALEQGSQSVLNKMTSDRVGLDTEFIVSMEEHRANYVNADVSQGSADANSEAAHTERNKQIEEIKDERVELQYVIDGEFPPGDPASAAVRRQFDLPANRPFNAIRRKAA